MRKLLLLVCVVVVLGCWGCMPPPPEQGTGPHVPTDAEFVTSTVWFILFGVFIYFILVLRPQFLKEDAHKKFTDELKKNDSVVTTGGILGKAVSVKDGIVTMEIASNVKIRVKSEHVLPAKGLDTTPAKPAAKDESKKKSK